MMKKVMLLMSLIICLWCAGCGKATSEASASSAKLVLEPSAGSEASASESTKDSENPVSEFPLDAERESSTRRPSSPLFDSVENPAGPAFNTLSNREGWGDEANFLRIADIDAEQAAEIEIAAVGGEYTVQVGHRYAIVVYSHNTSGRIQDNLVCALTCPDEITAGGDNLICAIVSWAEDPIKNPDCEIYDLLNLRATEDCLLTPICNGNGNNILFLNWYGASLELNPTAAFSMDGITTRILNIGKIDVDDTYIAMFVFKVLPRGSSR